MAEYITHVTREGERWDQLAVTYYGNPYRYEPITRANPQVPLTAALPRPDPSYSCPG